MAYLLLQKKTKWVLVHRDYDGHKVIKTRNVQLGTPEADGLGIFTGMEYVVAKQALLLHRADGKARYHQERRARIAAKQDQTRRAVAAWLPEALLLEFERLILPSLVKGRHDRWLIVKELLLPLEIPPYDWHLNPEIFWSVFKKRGWSAPYGRKLLRFLNKWGEFYCRRTGKPWTRIDSPDGGDREKIQAAHYERRHRPPTYQLEVSHLEKARGLMFPEQYNALALAFWCALRYEELTFVLKRPPGPDTWYLDQDERRKFYVFHIFQDKLRRKGVAPDQCWKSVPLVEPEQEALVAAIQANRFKAPPLLALRKQVGVALTNRSARKGFSMEMEKRGYTRLCVSDWLGHLGKDTVGRSYRSRRVAVYEPPVDWQTWKRSSAK